MLTRLRASGRSFSPSTSPGSGAASVFAGYAADPDSGTVPAELLTADGAYRWGASDLPMRVGRIASRNALSMYFRVPPREIVFLHRRLAGVFIMLSALRCELRTRETLLEALSLS